jgi:hypothetical protein
VGEDHLVAATRLLKQHNDSRDDEFFARRGLRNARDFHAQYLRLGAIFALVETTEEAPRAVFWPNREARHPLQKDIVAALSARFGSAPRA